jgi:hypothetical protein
MNKQLIIISLSVIMGAAPTWCVMHKRHAAFVNAVEQEGRDAAARSETVNESNRLAAKAANNEYQTRIDSVRAESQRLLDSRSSGGYVPAEAGSAPGAGEVVCFDREKLNAAIGRLDADVSGIAEGSDGQKERLNSIKSWWDSVLY